MQISHLRVSKLLFWTVLVVHPATQEELAKFVTVSAQAVSKWENGGVPDTELLPKIADFFGVSIDTLFGRSIAEYDNIKQALVKTIIDTPIKERMAKMFDLCWTIQRAYFGEVMSVGVATETIGKLQEELGDNLAYSRITCDEGFTEMGLSRALPYFLIAPEPAEKCKAHFHKIIERYNYEWFFKTLADKAFLDALFFLFKRDSNKEAFTHALLKKKIGIKRFMPKKAGRLPHPRQVCILPRNSLKKSAKRA